MIPDWIIRTLAVVGAFVLFFWVAFFAVVLIAKVSLTVRLWARRFLLGREARPKLAYPLVYEDQVSPIIPPADPWKLHTNLTVDEILERAGFVRGIPG